MFNDPRTRPGAPGRGLKSCGNLTFSRGPWAARYDGEKSSRYLANIFRAEYVSSTVRRPPAAIAFSNSAGARVAIALISQPDGPNLPDGI